MDLPSASSRPAPEASPGPRRVLMIFARAPELGQVKTRLARTLGDPEALRIYRLLGRLVVDQLRGGDYRAVIYFDPPEAEGALRGWLGEEGLEFRPQPAGGLGQRLDKAFEWGFRHGDEVCAVGTDIPGLDSARVEAAFTALSGGDADVVLGPAVDGGYYLIALRRPEPLLFRDIPWSTERVLQGTLERVKEAGLDVRLLEPLFDVDRPEDVPDFLGRGPPAE